MFQTTGIAVTDLAELMLHPAMDWASGTGGSSALRDFPKPHSPGALPSKSGSVQKIFETADGALVVQALACAS
jgi:hypothetical protein